MLWLRVSHLNLASQKSGHIFICALCVLLKNIQDTLLSPCPSVVTLTTVGVQDRAVFFYIHPLRQGVFFPMSPQGSGESQQTSIMKIPILQSTWFGLGSLHTIEVSCLFPSPLNPSPDSLSLALPRSRMSPVPPGLAQAMLPTQPPLLSCLSLTVCKPSQLPDGQVHRSSLHACGLWRTHRDELGRLGAFADLLTLFEDD